MTKEAEQYVATVAKHTEGYSGSDLKEVCRAAAWEPVRELTSGASRKAVGCVTDNANQSKMLKRTSSGFPPRGTKARPVDVNDFVSALQKVKKTGDSAREFHKKEFIRGREDRAAMAAEINKMNGKAPKQPVQVDMNQLIAAAMAAMSNTQNGDNNVNGQDKENEDSDSSDGPPEMFVDATNGLN